MRASLLDVPRHRIDEVDFVPAAGQPARVDAGASSHVQDMGGRGGKVALEHVLRARELDRAGSLEQLLRGWFDKAAEDFWRQVLARATRTALPNARASLESEAAIVDHQVP